VATDPRPVLHICLSCQTVGAAELAPGETPAGTRLHEAAAARLATNGAPTAVRLNPVVCMANCDFGCTAALSAPGKWGYIVGRLSPAMVDDLLAYAGTYGRSRTGVVLPSKRPASLRDVIIARLPAHPDDLLAGERAP
jgi:predicted metal-binding protein